LVVRKEDRRPVAQAVLEKDSVQPGTLSGAQTALSQPKTLL
jgi:hypothetical protein